MENNKTVSDVKKVHKTLKTDGSRLMNRVVTTNLVESITTFRRSRLLIYTSNY